MNLISNFPVSIASGSQTYGPANVPDNAASIKLTLARCTTGTPTIWPNKSTTIQANVEVSLDGGASWDFVGGFGAEGGIFVKRDGTESPSSSGSFNLPGGIGRKIRALVTVTNGPLVSQLSLDVN